ncbi:MAG TPA: ATP-binding protein [Pyrinomonadaceae bacterium]|nr:ATP-binding protein [Pyrinomonadaceae bacterium]
MAFLEILQLVGYSTAAALHAWIAASLVRRRRVLAPLERVLLVLAAALGVWHASNLLVALHAMLGLSEARWTVALRLTDTLAVASVTLTYSLLLHVHLYLWADARRRSLTWSERARVYLSYLPALFLVYALAKLWAGAYAPMFVKLSELLLPFALWAAYVLCLVAGTDFLIARLSKSQTERRLMRTLAASFLAIAALILAVYAFGLGRGAAAGEYLKTLANLGSLLPTALLAYHIYRYRYLELMLKESLILASFASAVLVVYLYGIRNIALWLTARYELREGSVESLLILLLVLLAAPLRRWLDRRFRRLFEQEAGLFRDVVARVGKSAGRYGQLPEFLRFVEERAAEGLSLRRVRLLAASDNEGETAVSFSPNGGKGSERPPGGGAAPVNENGARASAVSAQAAMNSPAVANSMRVNAAASVDADASVGPGVAPDATSSADGVGAEGWESGVLELARAAGWEPVEGADVLRAHGWELAYPLRREERVVGLMLVDADSAALTFETRSLLELLAGQVAIAIEDSRLVEENVRLERRIAQSERLAALGRMAATVAHEVKNPLSAIKSIAQVMREDEYLRREYARDLELIVGETDRLSSSVTQMLSFARTPPPAGSPLPADDLLQTVAQLSQRDAAARGVSVKLEVDSASVELDGARAAALRDAASNLVLNALQASRPGGRVRVEARAEGERLLVSVTDEGPGVPAERRERIWEPFFTTKQRGTGLGLAIVRKRIEEAGGEARLAPQRPGEGARFELTIPLGGNDER